MRVRDYLAWFQLIRQKGRFFVAIAGISFACILIFMQLGFLESLFVGATRPHSILNADLVIAHPTLQTLLTPKSFARERLYQVKGFTGVESVSAIQLANLQWRNPVDHQIRAILLLGIDPLKHALILPNFDSRLNELKMFRRVLFDQKSRPEYGPIKQLLERTGKLEVELNDKNVTVAGLFSLGASFAADGTAISSDTTFSYLSGNKSASQIQLGLIKISPDSSIAEVKRNLQRVFKNDISVYTRDEFAQLEKTYWADSTGIGFIFGLGVVVGFVVGVVIVYQILHSDVQDHMPEYATLKAMGYADSYLLGVLLKEALILSGAGFVPALLLTFFLYSIAESATSMPIFMTSERALFVFSLSLAMCSISAVIAMKKLRDADPADVF
ncbi:MAG: FtsX-like permease family protein [Leptolyngbya sp.]|nr:FtsX-like permease family protein [Candidatus Melainabacteria bacterium]